MRYIVNSRPASRGAALVRILPLTAAALLLQVAALGAQELRPDLEDVGSRWVTIDRVELGSVELDESRVVPLGPDVYQVRTRWRFASVQTSPEGYRYQTSVAVRGVDCRRRQMALIAFADHDGGTVVRTEAQPVYAARWDRVNPESIVDRIATRVCELGGSGSGAIAASAGG